MILKRSAHFQAVRVMGLELLLSYPFKFPGHYIIIVHTCVYYQHLPTLAVSILSLTSCLNIKSDWCITSSAVILTLCSLLSVSMACCADATLSRHFLMKLEHILETGYLHQKYIEI